MFLYIACTLYDLKNIFEFKVIQWHSRVTNRTGNIIIFGDVCYNFQKEIIVIA